MLFSVSCYAQAPSGTLAGHVQGANDEPLAGVSMSLAAPDRGEPHKTVTDANGWFAFPSLPATVYHLTIDNPGFHKRTEHLELSADQTLDLVIHLTPDTAQNPATARRAMRTRELHEDTSAGTDSVGRHELLALPLSDDPLRIISQTAGLSLLPTDEGLSTVVVGGARNENSNVFYDGFISMNPRAGTELIRPPVEALETVKTKADANSAQYARRAGLVATVVAKRGTNEFHGSVTGSFRNDLFNARTFFDAATPENMRQQYSGVLGGPMPIPGVKRKRTFFFMAFEYFRESLGTTRISGVPTAEERTGDFAKIVDYQGKPVILSDPFNPGSVYPNNQIPRSLFSPTALTVDNYFPLPNLPGSFNNYRVTASGVQSWTNLLGKFDHRFSSHDELSLRLQLQVTTINLPYSGSDLGTFGSSTHLNTLLSGVIWYHQFSATFFNEARASIQRATGLDSVSDTSDAVAKSGLPNYNFTGLASLGYNPSVEGSYALTYYEFADGFTLVRPRHVLKWGIEFQPFQQNQPVTKNFRGTINFQDKTWTGLAYGDFLLGLLRSSSLTVASQPNYVRSSTLGFFVQEAYKLKPTLTLNVGLRYERPPSLTEKYGRWSNFLPDMGVQVTAQPYNSLLYAEQLGLPQSLMYPSTRGLTPRVGLSWHPDNNLRVGASWGMFLSEPSSNAIRQDLAEVMPFVTIWPSTRNKADPTILTLDDPFPVGGIDKPSIAGFDLHPPRPYLLSWSFSLQDRLINGRTLELQYTGSKGTHLGRRYDLNQAPLDASMVNPDTGSIPRPYPCCKAINYYSFGSNSSYNALLAAFTRKLGDKSSLRLNYTYSKSVDDASLSYGAGAGGYAGAQDRRNLGLEKGRSDWDARHAAKVTYDLQSPWKKNPYLRGWAFSGVGTAASGLPFTPQVLKPDTGKGEASRPDRIARDQAPNPSPTLWYDPSAFPVIPAGSYRPGTSGRNVLDGPGLISLDLSLRRALSVSEGKRFEFRADAYNALNRANLGMPAIYVNAPNVGTIVSAKPGRAFQFSAKFAF